MYRNCNGIISGTFWNLVWISITTPKLRYTIDSYWFYHFEGSQKCSSCHEQAYHEVFIKPGRLYMLIMTESLLIATVILKHRAFMINIQIFFNISWKPNISESEVPVMAPQDNSSASHRGGVLPQWWGPCCFASLSICHWSPSIVWICLTWV